MIIHIKYVVMRTLKSFSATNLLCSFSQYINLKSDIPIRGGEIIPVSQLTGSVEFRDVTFSYPTRPGVVSNDVIHLLA